MIIDAHQHLWQIGRNGHEWPTPDLPAIHRDFAEADLRRAFSGTGVAGTVLVQSQPSDIDTLWMLDTAAHSELILGVVGWVDFAAPNAAARVSWLAKQPKLKGLRPMLQGLPQDDWILNPDFDPVFRAMLDGGLAFDALVFTRQLPAIDRLAQRYPDLPIVIDHGAKPPLARVRHPEEMQVWRDSLSRVAENANVMCKLSGFAAELSPSQSVDAMRPCADHILAMFGPVRMMWGSDWPVCLLRMDYRGWFDWVQQWLSPLTETERTAILGDNARAFYKLI